MGCVEGPVVLLVQEVRGQGLIGQETSDPSRPTTGGPLCGSAPAVLLSSLPERGPSLELQATERGWDLPPESQVSVASPRQAATWGMMVS